MTKDRHYGHRASHSKYRLTCEEYDALVLRSEGRCDRCGVPYAGLVIDHDHGLGNWAVRGMLCYSCNARVIGDCSLPWTSKSTRDYVMRRFRSTEPGPTRMIFPDPRLWGQFAEAVSTQGKSRSEVLNDLVKAYLAGQPMPDRP